MIKGTENLTSFMLTEQNFPQFYRRLLNMRFPIPVADVLELRDLVHHSLEQFEHPADMPHNREFEESLDNAITSFGIDSKRHADRMLQILLMLRDLHYQHSVSSRNMEQALREELAAQSEKRDRVWRNAQLTGLGLAVSVTAFFLTPLANLLVFAVVPAILAVTAIHFYRQLPRLDAMKLELTRRINDVLRERVDSLNWRTLIHKLALLLGYKQVKGVEVFRQTHDRDTNGLLH
jgi:hypothetical protein